MCVCGCVWLCVVVCVCVCVCLSCLYVRVTKKKMYRRSPGKTGILLQFHRKFEISRLHMILLILVHPRGWQESQFCSDSHDCLRAPHESNTALREQQAQQWLGALLLRRRRMRCGIHDTHDWSDYPTGDGRMFVQQRLQLPINSEVGSRRKCNGCLFWVTNKHCCQQCCVRPMAPISSAMNAQVELCAYILAR